MRSGATGAVACFLLSDRPMATRPTILVVDDELGVRESLRAILSQDCDVRTAATGSEAIAAVQREPIALVTLDLRMPGMSGIDVLEAIKRIDPDIEALIITGYGSFDTAVQGLRHRAFDYLAKPFDTQQVRATVQAALARRAATQRLRTVPDSILATLSHEFRTPLNVIMGYSSMLAEDGERALNEEQRAALDRIQANSTTLLAYVETLFYLIELERGLVPVAPQTVDVLAVASRVRQELAGAAAAKALELRFDLPPALELVSDHDMLLRLLLALAENAVRHTGRGAVAVSAGPGPDGVRIAVADSGGGLDASVARDLEALVRDPSNAAPRSLGFGLRLIGRLVRELRGTLAIASAAGGTRFELELPHLDYAAAAEVDRVRATGTS